MEAVEGIATKTTPPRWWITVTIVAGVIGALSAVAAMGSKTYDIDSLRVELSAKPSLGGASQIAVRVPKVPTGHATANTHFSPIDFRMTIVGVSPSAVVNPALLTDPYTGVKEIRFSERGKKAIGDFGKRLALLALGGGAAGGALVSFGRWKRIAGGALAGMLALALIGVLLHQTYDVEKFRNTNYVTGSG